MIHLLLFKDGGRENDALAALLDTGAKKKCAEVLLYGARTYVEFCGNIFVAATLHQKVEDLLVAVSDFDLIEVKHDFLSAQLHSLQLPRRKARPSPYFRFGTRRAKYRRNQQLVEIGGHCPIT
jgi:hypothetical protein